MSSSPNVLLVIGSGLKLYREYLVRSAAARARAAGHQLVLINNLQPTWQHEYFADIEVVNVFDHALLARTAREMATRYTVAGVLCWDEPLVMPAAELAAEFGVPGLSVPGVQGCRDKYSARTRLTEAGLLQPGFAMTADLAQARAAAERIGYPVVVKPRALGASMGVVLAEDEARLTEAFEVASGASLVGDEPFRGGAIVEQYAVGPEISVDGAVHKGEYLPMFLARKRTGPHPYFEEIGHVVDAADPLLHDPVLMETLARAHRVLGIEDGITHSEVRLTDQGPLIIEINGRVGGDLIPYLGKIATGIDPGEVMVDVALGQRPEITRSQRGAVGIRFGYPATDCLVHSVEVPQEAPGLVTASPMVEPGTTLRLPPGGYIARHSFVVCQADDPVTCEQRLDAAAALVVVTAEQVAAKPPGAVLEMPAGLLDVDE
ncbi:ATP-grasp domain-containing protein [Solwaraspora sp. WMMA2056]|uniref:ATP-grasp domain-containing protein n=1 Tax=Solwaraspora sp. WMMA2056 TaxID=3015161 RepID=UPI00259BB7CB|nr:ATP-grasp domain-containing protein [Solwaraspora sp. WMMA2056]WJK43534.1 ATP-grasp domain-containing protein [Solwaraspora sp. WMMA2056]